MSPEQPHNPDCSARQAAWSDYWASGALHSCAGSFEQNYSGPIADFWQRQLEQVAAPARLLEVCCGNAPLSKWIHDHSDLLSAGSTVDATDLANVQPRWLLDLAPQARAQIRVRGQVDARALPFADQHFDLTMSQYGIEYVGREGLAELLRVTRVGGRIAAVIHHHDSLPVCYGRAELQALDWLGGPDDLLERAARLIEPMARSASPAGLASLRGDADAAKRRSQFNEGLQALQQRQVDPLQAPLLDEVARHLMAILDLARTAGQVAAESSLDQERQRLQQVELRQRELVDCAFSEATLRDWLSLPSARVTEMAAITLDEAALAGWAVVLQRS